MKMVEWRDGQKLRPVDLEYQSIFMRDGVLEMYENIIGSSVSLLDVAINLDYLNAGVFKLSHFVGFINRKLITYPAYDDDELIYEVSSVDLKTVESTKCEIFISEDKSIIGKTQKEKVPYKLPTLLVSVDDEVPNGLKICDLECDENGVWKVCSSYIPRVQRLNDFIKKLVEDKLRLLLFDVKSYALDQYNKAEEEGRASNLLRIISSIEELSYSLSSRFNDTVFCDFLINRLITLNIFFARYHLEGDVQSAMFYVSKDDSLDKTISNFIKAMRDLMVAEVEDEKITFVKEGDQLNALLRTEKSKDSARSRLYLMLMKPRVDFNYNPRKIRLSSPSRMQELRSLSIPGVKLLEKSYNPTSVVIDRKFYDIFELLPSREMDYINSEGILVCDILTLPEEVRIFIVRQDGDK